MRSVLLAVMSMGLVGCIGQLDSPGAGSVGDGTNPPPTSGTGGGPSMGKQMFEANVYPIIKNPGQLSDCSSCHDSAAPAGNVTRLRVGERLGRLRDDHELPGGRR